MDDQNASFDEDRYRRPPPEPPPPPGPGNGPRQTWVIVVVVVGVLVSGIATAIVLRPTEGVRETTQSASTTPPGNEDPPPATPGGIKADTDAFRVVLSWSVDESAGPLEGIRIYRDGNLIKTTLPTVSSYADLTVTPSTRYSYGVEAFGTGFLASKRGVIHVRTRSASPKDAPVEGTFDVRLILTSSYGLTGVKDETAGWRLSPTCASDSCGVRLIDIHRELPPLEFRRVREGYLIKDSGHLGLVCGGTPLDVSYRLEFRVTKAGVVNGEWRAQRIEGTFTESVAAQLGCRSGGATYRFTGNLVERGQ